MNLLLSTQTQSLITRDNITLLLSVIGALGTCITLISSFLHKRKNLKIHITDAEYNKNQNQMLLTLAFENRSQLPIAITSVRIFLNGHELSAAKYPICVSQYTHRHGSEVVDRKFLYNLNFPITIQQLGAFAGKMLLEFSPKELENPSTPLTLQVHSTRGKVQQITLPCDQIKRI